VTNKCSLVGLGLSSYRLSSFRLWTFVLLSFGGERQDGCGLSSFFFRLWHWSFLLLSFGGENSGDLKKTLRRVRFDEETHIFPNAF
jgi:hypothetical protein